MEEWEEAGHNMLYCNHGNMHCLLSYMQFIHLDNLNTNTSSCLGATYPISMSLWAGAGVGFGFDYKNKK